MSLLSLTPAGATCAAWYDAYDRSTITLDDGRITAVADKSGGTEYDLANSESTATEHPEYSEADGAIKYTSGADQYLKNADFTQDWSAVTVVVSYTSTGDPGFGLLFSQDDTSMTGDFSLLMSYNAGQAKTNFEYRLGGSYSTFAHDNATDTLRIMLKGHEAAGSPSDTDVYQHHSATKTETRNMAGTNDTGLLVGAPISWPSSLALNIHELAIYDTYMDAATSAPIEEYFLNHGPPAAPAQSPPSMGLGIKSRRG
jgi:hypothetical protein